MASWHVEHDGAYTFGTKSSSYVGHDGPALLDGGVLGLGPLDVPPPAPDVSPPVLGVPPLAFDVSPPAPAVSPLTPVSPPTLEIVMLGL